MQDFVHLNVHSHYSILTSQITIPAAVDKAVADGMKGIALTDDGVMYGIKEFVDYCAKVNRGCRRGPVPFKPIIGCEMYVAPRSLYDKEEGDEICTRLILLVKNLIGYKNLIKLVSDSWTKGLMGETPRTDFNELEKHKEGIIVCAPCLKSVISKRILNDDLQGAGKALDWFKYVWGNDFYMEIQRHEVKDSNLHANHNVYPLQQRVNTVIIELAKKYNVKLICSNNCHFVNEEDAEAHDRILCLLQGKKLDDPTRKLCTKQEWLKTRGEMNEAFADIPKALSNTLEILDKVELYSIENDHGPLLPHFSIPESFGTIEEWRKRFTAIDIVKEFTSDENGNNPMTDDQALAYIKEITGKWWNIDRMYRVKFQSDYLTTLTYDGAERIYGTLTPQIEERLRFELHHIKINGFPEYFLFVQDYVNAAQKDLNVWVGPGRGSAVGSLVNYCLGITKVDPLKYGLLFERFIRLNHVSLLPDIDIELDADGRNKVLHWIKEKYGDENCARIITFDTMDAKASIKEDACVEDLPPERTEALCQIVPDYGYKANFSLRKLLSINEYDGKPESPELVAVLDGENKKEANTIKYASQIEGTLRDINVHACGFVICPDAITNYVPVSIVKEDNSEVKLLSQYDSHQIEEMGLVKFDILESGTLSEMKECLRLIKENKGISIDIDHIPLDDENTLKLYQEGRTTGTFNFDYPGMQKYLRELHPTVFGDLVAMYALYRPGLMDYIPAFITRKNGEEKITYDLPIMEKYLKETQGIPVYQEQIMHLVREIAGFTRYQSDVIRQALSKRKRDVYDAFKPRFIEGGQINGYETHTLEKIWSDWEKFGSYAFNKSHAVAYTLIAYQTAYLKANYPEEYMSALLRSRKRESKETKKLIRECKSMGIKLL